MIYVYAITDRRPRGFRNLGLESEPVVTTPSSGLHVVHTEHPAGFQPQAEPDTLWAHEAVVDELLELGAVVPFRFGTTLPDRAAAVALIARNADAFCRKLAEVR